MPRRRPHGGLAESVGKSSPSDITDAQIAAGVGSDLLRSDICLQPVGRAREDRHDLIHGFVFIVATDREGYPETRVSMITLRTGKVDGQIRCAAGSPVKPRVQRRSFKLAVEHQVAFS